MKKLAITTLALTLQLSLVTVAFAQTKEASKAADTKVATQTATKKPGVLGTIIEKGDAAIDNRIESLEKVLSKVEGAKFLTAAQKDGLVKDIETTAEGLATLGDKLDAQTTAEAARADYQKIFGDFRVYAVFIPRIHANVTIDRMLTHITLMNKFGDKLNARITKAKTAGTDTKTLDTQYADYKAKTTAAKTKVDAAAALLPQLTASNSAKAKTTLTQIRTNLKGASDDVKAAHKSAADILAGLKAIKTATGSAQKDATRSATASAKTATDSATKTATPSAR